ncbi:MAG TPA: tRNA (cytidine(34)-2'-O)-methyltransferase [Steroidobacteraceae bacterium]
MFHIVLVEPEIPPNTGNIIRLCANSGAKLHLVKPLGFDLDRRSVRRAGLDYDSLADIAVHDSFTACEAALKTVRLFALETGAARSYAQPRFRPGDAFIFGSETRGLPPHVLEGVPPTQRLALPMRAGNRSLNLSNAVAVMIYEAWRQNDFAGSAG